MNSLHATFNNLLLHLLILGLFPSLVDANDKLFSISFGPVQLGESRVPINLEDFKILYQATSRKNIKAEFVPDSVQWVRSKGNLLSPRALLKISIPGRSARVHIKYLDNTIIPTLESNQLTTSIYVNLFSPSDIVIKHDQNVLEVISFKALHSDQNKKSQVIDYSCSSYQISIEGLDHEYLSLGCHIETLGAWGAETPRLEVTWSATNFKLLDGTVPPYTTFLQDDNPVKLTVVDQEGQEKIITIRAKLPERMHRLKTAFGLGPYLLESKSRELPTQEQWAPAVMMYGKLELSSATSLRAFDALVFNHAMFNNAGLYFAYEMADAFDGRLMLIPLLGAQVLSFKADKAGILNHEVIFPQGFEAVYKHPFGQENYSFIYGMFLSTSSEVTYNNIWLRYGKRFFWELNYIEWGQNQERAKTWGLSIGFPLFSIF